MGQNYYVLLGLTADASREDIKAAFRRRALELHPDRSGLESGPFQEVQEAYSVLGDPERRQHYDRERTPRAVSRQRPAPAPEPLRRRPRRAEPFRRAHASAGLPDVSLMESFETYHPSFAEIFDRFWSNFADVARPKSEGLESLTLEVPLSSQEAARGGQVRVWIPARASCPACGGHGQVGLYQCWQCEGHGALTAEYPIEVGYPARLPDGYAVQVPLSRFGIQNLYLTVLFRLS
jgi:molecular chaperone DnaJ